MSTYIPAWEKGLISIVIATSSQLLYKPKQQIAHFFRDTQKNLSIPRGILITPYSEPCDTSYVSMLSKLQVDTLLSTIYSARKIR